MEKKAFSNFFEYARAMGGGLDGALGVDGGRSPLPTRPKRYCDHASLVLCFFLGGRGESNIDFSYNYFLNFETHHLSQSTDTLRSKNRISQFHYSNSLHDGDIFLSNLE